MYRVRSIWWHTHHLTRLPLMLRSCMPKIAHKPGDSCLSYSNFLENYLNWFDLIIVGLFSKFSKNFFFLTKQRRNISCQSWKINWANGCWLILKIWWLIYYLYSYDSYHVDNCLNLNGITRHFAQEFVLSVKERRERERGKILKKKK